MNRGCTNRSQFPWKWRVSTLLKIKELQLDNSLCENMLPSRPQMRLGCLRLWAVRSLHLDWEQGVPTQGDPLNASKKTTSHGSESCTPIGTREAGQRVGYLSCILLTWVWSSTFPVIPRTPSGVNPEHSALSITRFNLTLEKLN